MRCAAPLPGGPMAGGEMAGGEMAGGVVPQPVCRHLVGSAELRGVGGAVHVCRKGGLEIS